MLEINRCARRVLSATVFLIVICASWLSARTVTSLEAAKAAMVHLEAMREDCSQLPHLKGQVLTLSQVQALHEPESDKLLGYVAELAPKGFVVLSANTELAPIIAYSYHSDFPWEDDPNNILLHMVQTDLALRNQALDITDAGTLSANDYSWQAYLAGNVPFQITGQWPSSGSTSTGGWIENTWSQGFPYNSYCPIDPETGGRCVVGCVATAMSQIVDYNSDRRDYMDDVQLYLYDRYYSMATSPYIRIDQDSSKYDFPSFNVMNEYLKDLRAIYIADSTPWYYDVATLAFACGIFVEMHYSSGGSGSSVKQVAFALMYKLGYPKAMYVRGNTSWFYDTLSQNMKDSMPAELGICWSNGSYGHAIVCDGLRETEGSDDEYHLNFGWGGDSPAPIKTAWYVLPQGMPAGYSVVTGAVLSIIPPEGSYVAESAESNPGTFSIESISPTLQNAPASFTLSYGLPYRTRIRLVIYDINGRVIRTLVNGNNSAGYHQASWDTRDSNGRQVPSGAYFCVLQTEKGTYKTKAVVIR